MKQLKVRWLQMQWIAEANGIERCSLFFVGRNSAAGYRYETASAVFFVGCSLALSGRLSFVPKASLE
jgi:hypothetical protein